MIDDNKNNITYDDDWKSVSTAEYARSYSEVDEDTEDSEEHKSTEKKKKNSNSPKQYLITIQLVICIIIALAAFVLSSIGGEVYAAAREWYYTNLNKSVIFDMGYKQINLNELFAASSDEA